MGLLQSIGLAQEKSQLSVGSRAPQVTATDEQGNKVDLDQIFAQGLTLVYFFPKALTPVCTSQSCEFRDDYKIFTEKEIRIFGISRDRPDTLKRFKEKNQLPFPLLCDSDGRLCKAFSVPIIFSVSLRHTFLIRQDIVVWRDLHPEVGQQTEKILKVLAQLKPI